MEAITLCGMNVMVFGYMMGRGHYDYVFAMLLPSLVLSLIIAVAEGLYLWWRHGLNSFASTKLLTATAHDIGAALSLTNKKPLRTLSKLFKKFRAGARHPSLST